MRDVINVRVRKLGGDWAVTDRHGSVMAWADTAVDALYRADLIGQAVREAYLKGRADGALGDLF